MCSHQHRVFPVTLWTGRSQLIPRASGLLILMLSASASDAKAQCDPDLVDRARGRIHGYAARGERCEGIYVEEVGGTTLIFASFTEVFEPYDSNNVGSLVVEWEASGGQTLELRARGIRHGLYYQMDATRPSGPGSHTWDWPKDILAPLGIGRNSIGIWGRTRQIVGDAERNVYVPLRVGQGPHIEGDGTYEVVLFPSVRLDSVFVTLAPVLPDGGMGDFIREDRPLSYGYYPADRAIRIPISDLETPGIYYLEIGARLASGGSATLRRWIYRPQG